MTDTELTKMLRSSANRVVNYAADRIETLTAERDGLLRCVTDNHVALCRAEAAEAERDRLGRELNAAKYGQPDFAWSVHLAAMAEVQAERDRLRAIGTEMAESIEGNYYLPGVATRWRAALKGETP